MAKVTVLIGLPGSGKSTYAKNNLKGVYICPDEVRKELYGDISIQGDGRKVFAIIDAMLFDAISAGKDVIYDATNVAYRHKLVKRLRDMGADRVDAVMLDTPFSVCVKRNKNRNDRSEPVPDEVMERMAKSFKKTKRKIRYDGFDNFKIVKI